MARRLLSLLLLVCFGYFNAEAAIADGCDGDGVGVVTMPGDVHVTAAQSAPVPSDQSPRPAHNVVHVCHCAHAHGTLTTTMPSRAGVPLLHHEVTETALLQPFGTDRDVHLRPPIARRLDG